MAPKPKAGGSKKRTTKAMVEAKEKPQRERFIEAARAVGVDESGAGFERAIKEIVQPKRAKSLPG